MLRRLAIAVALAGCSAANAQDVSGTWQGTANTQRVLKIVPASHSGFRGSYYNLGRKGFSDPTEEPVSNISLKGRTVSFDLEHNAGSYRGALSPDGKSITGTWNAGTPQPLTFTRAAKKTEWVIDASPHSKRFVTVDKNVRLEVLDWGGSGPPLVFLTGWGNTAHVYDDFAPKFTANHHVYGITRRGFGVSSAPLPTRENFDADRLADDVLETIAALNLDRPIIVGHSVAGQEMSSIGTRQPQKVAALIYLDAAQSNAFYNPDGGYTAQVEADDMRRELEKLPKGFAELPEQIKAVLKHIPLLQKSLERDLATVEGSPERSSGPRVSYQ